MNTSPHKTLYRQICNSPYFQNVRRYLCADDLRGINKIEIKTEAQIIAEEADSIAYWGFIPAGLFDFRTDSLMVSSAWAQEPSDVIPGASYAENALLHEIGHFHGLRANQHDHFFFYGFYFSQNYPRQAYFNRSTCETFAELYMLYKCNLLRGDALRVFKSLRL